MRKHIFFAVLVIFCFALAFAPVSYAKLVKSYEDGNGSAVLYSTIKLKNQDWDNIALWKLLKPGVPYRLEITTYGYKEWIFFDGQVSIHIKDTWYELDTEHQKTQNDWPNVITTAQYIIPDPVIEELSHLKSTDTVELRLHFQDKTFVHWSVPSEIITEWQDLIQRTR